MPTQNGLGLDEDDRPPPRRQPPRTDEQLQSINEAERGPLAATTQAVDLVAKHRVLEYQFASGPDRVHGDGCELAGLRMGRQLRPQSLHASEDPDPDARDTHQAHPSLGPQTGSRSSPATSSTPAALAPRCAG
jgi:hypothetical protein